MPINTRRRIPSQQQLVLPMIALLKESITPMQARDVAAELGRQNGLSPSQLTETVKTSDGQKTEIWSRHVRFAKLKAQTMGYLTTAGRGLWQATDEGQAGISQASPRIRIQVLLSRARESLSATIEIDMDVGLPTIHTLMQGDARDLSWIPTNEIGLAISSVPYHDLKQYSTHDAQLGNISQYDEFLDEMETVLAEIQRVLTPGGRFACNVGDVLTSRKKHGTHHILPLHADLLVRGRKVGLQALNGIQWQKVGNTKYEQGPGGILGKPNQPNQIIQLDREHILLMRKPGDYPHPSQGQRDASFITKDEHRQWFRSTWSDIPGARPNPSHPAPFPVEIPYRLSRMFSFVGDTVLDPFAGSFTTSLAAAKAGRHSVGIDINEKFVDAGISRIKREYSSV